MILEPKKIKFVTASTFPSFTYQEVMGLDATILVFFNFPRVKWGVILFYNDKREVVTAAAAKSLQSCPTLCNPIDGSPPGSPVPGILQARTLELVAFFSNA